MSHQFESGLFTNSEAAWHGLGNVIEGKVYDLKEALEKASMDWTVEKVPTYYKDKDGNFIEIDSRKAVLRTKNGIEDFIDTVSDRYELLQNSEAFQLIEPFLHEKECFISSLISLAGGKKICLVAQIEDNIREVVKNDTVKSYILLASSHNGSLSTIIKNTETRTVCANTLKSALMNDGAQKTVRHTKNQKVKLAAIQDTMNIYKRNFEADVQLYKQMASKEVSTEDFRAILERTFAKEMQAAANSRNIPKDEMTIMDCRITKKAFINYGNSPDLQLEGVRNTGWAAFNAITEAIKNRSSDLDSRYDSIWFGPDSKTLDKAKEVVLQFV